VLVGRDTRPSGVALATVCCAGVRAAGVSPIEIGVVTTPELHFTVQTYNAYHALEESAYFTSLLESYRSLASSGSRPATPQDQSQQQAQQPLHVDCANGVGALKLQQMLPQLQQLGLQLVLHNTGEGRLNHLCGADFVQKEQAFPAGEGTGQGRVCVVKQAVGWTGTIMEPRTHVKGLPCPACACRHGAAAARADVCQPGW
jgi:phosphoacetylglucosamine mutase